MSLNNGPTIMDSESQSSSDATSENDIKSIIKEYQNHQNQFNQQILEKIQKLAERQEEILKEIRNEQKESKNVVSTRKSFQTNENPMKKFEIKHTFKQVFGMKTDEEKFGDKEDFFGVSWILKIRRNKEHLGCYIYCMDTFENEQKFIEAELDIKLISNKKEIRTRRTMVRFGMVKGKTDRGWGWTDYVELKELQENSWMVFGEITVECQMKIKRMIGVYKDNLRAFDESMREFSDIVLTVNAEKFHVSKLYLASHSPFFKTLFFGRFDESSQSEIKLSGIDADDFQNYLEVLYGENAIDDSTIEGILLIADMYDTQIVIKKCEDFLWRNSRKSLKKKIDMAIKYNFEQLKRKSINKLRNVEEVREITSYNFKSLDKSTLSTLLQKTLKFQ